MTGLTWFDAIVLWSLGLGWSILFALVGMSHARSDERKKIARRVRERLRKDGQACLGQAIAYEIAGKGVDE